MNFASCRMCTALVIAFFLLLMGAGPVATQDASPYDAAPRGTIPEPVPNRLQNADFECDNGGYYVAKNGRNEDILLPNGWTLLANGQVPVLSSARIYFEGPKGSCATDRKHVERISGRDSFFAASLDIETPPEPGKPFDIAIYQQVPAISGTAYSLSGWQLTLCGGSAVPNDCPGGHYMAKMLGIDPTGGTDINSPQIVWGDNRNNFVDDEGERIGWSNVRTSAMAANNLITVFARIDSPFRWHGNHGFIDALSLVQAPAAALQATTAQTGSAPGILVKLAWNGSLGSDIPTIGGSYKLLYDVQYWHPRNGVWRDLQEEHDGAGSMEFAALCTGEAYQFRVRARAEQPHGTGVWPNQRYPGVWSEPISVPIPFAGVLAPQQPQVVDRLYLPAISTAGRGC